MPTHYFLVDLAEADSADSDSDVVGTEVTGVKAALDADVDLDSEDRKEDDTTKKEKPRKFKSYTTKKLLSNCIRLECWHYARNKTVQTM